MKQSTLQKSRRQMETEIQHMQDEVQALEIKIKQMKTRQKFQPLQRLSFITPFIKALVLTAAILFVYAQFGIN